VPDGFSAPLKMAATESPIFPHWLSRFCEQQAMCIEKAAITKVLREEAAFSELFTHIS